MTKWNPKANEIFLNAVDMETEIGRREYVQSACGDDDTLREEVEGLLAAHGVVQGPLDRPFEDPSRTTPFTTVSRQLDESVGPYRLCGIIAEGGMGVVYEAEQQEPVRRTVALKIIKPGMDSEEVISRFETERQTLALMDHPNIARVLDAGSTETHQPYFVMELVRGTPITTCCDEYRSSLHQRLTLFIQVCQAVQHAHQKGIIHRDIKPSNVLVTMKDGVPAPKVIDFGVAKALDQHLTEQSHRTRFTQMVGTPLYMSPEQASLNGIDVDTRSDIYSLGVLLYELLTGTTPCQTERLEKASYAEFRRIKCEELAVRPSTRVAELAGSSTQISERRGTDPDKLTRALRGELDWIVMKALDKDRQRRYQTARGLAADVNRYLRNEPVEAGPPSATYRVRKFMSRHRGLIFAAAIVLMALLAGTAVSVWQAIRATNAERLATQRMWIADEALKQAETANERSKRNRAQALTSNGAFLAAIKKFDLALQQYQGAVAVDPNSPHANNNFAWFLVTCPDKKYHNPEYAIQLARKAVELVPDQGTFWNTLGVCHYRAGHWEEALTALQRSSERLGDVGIGFNAMFIAMAHWQLGNHEEAQRQYDLAVRWMHENQVVDDEFVRFCDEAAQLLGRSKENLREPEREPAEVAAESTDGD